MFDAYDSWRNALFRLGIGRHADFRRQAEAFWRAKQFGKAATCYRLHLSHHPEDFTSWLDLGFCEAYSGRRDRAEQAYAAARSAAPQSVTGILSVARERAISERPLSAFAYYRQAVLADPQREMGTEDRPFVGEGFLPEALSDRSLVGRRMLLDVTDLLRYLRYNPHGTGIQRVLLSMIAAWFRKFRYQDVVFVFCREGRSEVFEIAEQELAALVDATEDPATTVKIYQPYIDKIYAESPRVEFRPGDAFVVMGAFWSSIDYLRTLVDLRARGVLVGAYIYDLISITHPEFINKSDLNSVLDRFGDLLSEVDFVCAISEFVAEEVRDVLRDRLGRSVPVVAVPLAHDPPRSGDGQIESTFLKTLPAEYVLCICTIEGRKNHLLLFEVWQQLLAKYGDATPPLIVVGRWGWRGEAFKKRLEETQSLSGKIIVLGNLSDAKIDYLYRHCLFTVFPSFVEGWGLPVGESLACGTPCIASNATSIPEVGGDLVRYIDPYDAQSAFAVIEKPLIDRQNLAEWRSKVASTFQPRTWIDVVDNFLVQVEYCARSVKPQQATEVVPLIAGRTYHFSTDTNDSLANWRDRAHKFIFLDGWHGIESWGIWSSKPIAQLSILTELASESRVRVRFLIRGAPPKREARIGLRDLLGGAMKCITVPTDKAVWVETTAVVDETHKLLLNLERIDGDYAQAELERDLYLGLCAMVYDAEQTTNTPVLLSSNDLERAAQPISGGASSS
ncbi:MULTISPECIES: glycosyltransferase family 1 protein [unclassified Beijerinckia]|uniref:glycosyltransferase family 4 protein n=1 Tax=unclassified Beijerinckia TaxID=2638183 RepID=UPI000B8311BC|nr:MULTISPECIES: glycosyltransferase family 1 protein [unclassified Beijerinckia]